MYKIFALVVFVATMSTAATGQTGNELKAECIKTSYMLALGKSASSGEVAYWMGQNLPAYETIKTLIENHRQYLQGNTSMKKDMIRRSFRNAYGRTPTETEVATNMAKNYTYSDWITNHVAYLRKSSWDYENVIRNAYQNVMGRQPQTGEMSSWKSKPAMAYYILASCIDYCKKTSGTTTCTSSVVGKTSTSFADILIVSPQTAAQASNIIGSAAGNVVAAGGGNAVASGGANAVASGGGN